MQLRITSKVAQIGINRTPGKLEINQSKPEINMKTQPPKIQIKSEQSKVQIDQYPCFKEEGQKNVEDLIKDQAVFAKQKAQQGISRIVRQGNQMAAIENKRDVIPSQAKENAHDLFNKEADVGVIPKSRPKINFAGGKAETTAEWGKVNINAKVSKPNINYTKGQLEIYLKQKNSLNIEWVGEKFNRLG
ncbi:MAG: DUF6470 family protein [Marinisporobacter sp.]|jgi:hypothetical protein|nr:DUF6470 family protein [Marinisporobacter sp.]